MAEQRLDVKVTESGTAVVVSQLEKLSGQLKEVESAQAREAAAAERSAKATEGIAASTEKWLKSQESKFAVVDRVAGLLGKFNLALELVSKAYQLGKVWVDEYIRKVQDLAPALDAVNKRLAIQAKEVERIAGVRKGLLGAGATIDEVSQAAKLEGQRIEAEAKMAELDAEAQRSRAMLGTNATRYVDAPGALPLPQIIEATARAGLRPLEVINKELELVQERAFGAQLKLDKLRADVNARNLGSGRAPARGAAGRPGAPGGPDDLELAMDAEAAQAMALLAASGGASDSSALPLEGTTDLMDAGVAQAMAFAQALAGVAEELEKIRKEEEDLEKAYERAEDAGLGFAEAAGKGALASVAAALAEGESVAAALEVYLRGKAVEAGVEALWATGKALFYSATGNPAAGPMFAAAGYFAATAAAAGVGSAVAGSIGGGGGGGGAPSSRDIGPRREDREVASGPTTINVQIDGLSLSTASQVSEAVMGAMERARNTPGQRNRLERIFNGGAR